MAVAGSGLLQLTAARNKTEIVPLLWMTARRGRAIAALSTMNMILTHVQHVICLALEKREKGAHQKILSAETSACFSHQMLKMRNQLTHFDSQQP